MMKLNRFALVAGVLALGVAACGDDVQVVEPTPPQPPPPPPVTATMAPASASVAVGNSVVFAVNASGGVAGEAASWTCSSSNTGIATVTSTSAGCSATGVAAGDVTITASVTKSGETVNVGAQLTVTSDEEPTQPAGDPAFILISAIGDGDTGTPDDDGVLSGEVSVTVNVERGDQTLQQLSILVDGTVVDYQSFGSSMGMAPPEEEPAEQAVHAFTLSFDSGGYDEHGDHVDIDHMNGEHTISAELQIAGGMMADGMMGHQTVSSNAITVDFSNDDGVHLDATAPSGSALDDDGNVWYGGPGTSLAITALPVLYSGGSASAVTMKAFCGDDAATDDEAPFEFAPDCEKEGETTSEATPEFTLTVGGDGIEVGADDILNGDDDIFPINLDYEGPGAPTFRPNPNDREDGWINGGVAFTSTSNRNDDSWLRSGGEGGGVGGYTPQLRFAAVPRGDADGGLTEALEAIALAAVPPGAQPPDSRTGSSYCVIASAVDDLGNESRLPDDEHGTCVIAGVSTIDIEDDATTLDVDESANNREGTGYTKLLEDLAAAEEAEDDEAIEDAQDALADAGLRAGVDTSPPTAEFVGASLRSNSKTVNIDGTDPADPTIQYVLHLDDNRGLRVTEPVVDTLVYRDDDGDLDGVATTVAQQATPDDSPLYDVSFANDGVGYYTYTAQGQDKAGNLSAEITRTALHDTAVPVSALIFARGDNASEYSKTLVMADNLSVRSYSMVLAATNLPVPLRLNHAVVDAYNGDLTQAETVSAEVELPFIAVVGGTPDGTVAQADVLQSITAYVADQAGNSDNDVVTLGATGGNAISVEEDGDLETDEGVIAGTYTIEVEDDDGAITAENDVERSDETITLTVTADVALATTINPFADGVLFYAEVGGINTELVGAGTDRTELRLIGMVAGNSAEVDADADSREFTYETEVSADDFYAIVGSSAGDYNVRALGINGSGVAHVMTFTPALGIARR